MQAVKISIDELKDFIIAGFFNDYGIFDYYDKGEKIETLEDVYDNVFQKIKTLYPESENYGVLINDKKVGYFSFEENMLISFTLNDAYRMPEYLKEFWSIIKSVVGNNFKCVLYSYNTRAVNWLIKCGMQPILTNVTILQSCQQED